MTHRKKKRLTKTFIPGCYFVYAVAVLCLACSATTRAKGQKAEKETFPAEALIIRHAEKPGDDEKSVHLSAAGALRAEALHHLFEKSDHRPEPFQTPDFIVATRDTKSSHRPVETVTELAKKLKLPIEATIANDDFADLVHELFHNPKYAGKTVLICWHHGNVPALAHALRATGAPEEWNKAVFDRVWQIRYGDKGKTTFQDRPQHLMAGDAEK